MACITIFKIGNAASFLNVLFCLVIFYTYKYICWQTWWIMIKYLGDTCFEEIYDIFKIQDLKLGGVDCES